MNVIHNQHILPQSAMAMLRHTMISVGRPSAILGLVKAWIKLPMIYSAGQTHAAIPNASFAELFPEFRGEPIAVSGESLSRHAWNVKLHEEIYLAAAVKALKPKKIFEIGSFNGQTTVQLATAAPENSVVYTIDLPEDRFDQTQDPDSFNGARVGEKYRDSAVAHKVQQLRADATTFDFSPYYHEIDFIFVDAAHDYSHGRIDSQNALKMVKPGGAVVWHDFEPYWSGLVHAICEVAAGLPLRRLAGTSMAVLRIPGEN